MNYDLTFVTVLAATERLKELSQTSLSSTQGHLTGNGDPLHVLVSSASELQQPVLLQTGQQGSSSQKGLPAAAIDQALSKTEQLSVNQSFRSLSGKESCPHVHLENLAHQVFIISLR